MLAWVLIVLYLMAVTFAVSALLVPVSASIARRFKILDYPGARKSHSKPIPLIGGIAVFASCVIVIGGHYLVLLVLRHGWVELPAGYDFLARYAMSAHLSFVMLAVLGAGSLIIVTIGLLDDMIDLSARERLLWQTLAAIVVVSLGIKPDFFDFPAYITWPIAIVWIVGVTNSINLIDGMNGLASGVAMIISGVLAATMFYGGQPMNAMLFVVLVGAIAGFYVHNFPVASIFMGSTGSMFIGFFLGCTTIISTFNVMHYNHAIPIIMPVLIFGVPLYDTFSVILIRFRHGRPIYMGDRNHLVHRLVRIGFSPKQAVYFIHLMTLCIGINSLLLLYTTLLQSLIILVQILMLFGIIILLERVYVKKETRHLYRSSGAGAGG